MARLAWRKRPADPIQCGRLDRVSSRGGDEHAEACAWFEGYLDVLGLEHEYEPDLGTTKKPDFLVTTPTGPVVCEVKAFSPQPMPSEGFYVRGMREVLTTSRNSMRSAARQLHELAGQGIPLVIVLANPADAHVSLDHVVHAMYGDMQAVITGHGDGSTSNELLATLNGRLRNDHPYVSGVLVLRKGSRQQDALRAWQPSRDDLTPEEFTAELNAYVESITADGLDTYLEATFVEAPGREATPLPEGVFVGENAHRWRLSASRTTITRGPA
jgi:hypothetical protein